MNQKLLKIVTAIMMSVTLLLGNCLPFMSQGTALAATQYKYQYQRNKQAKSNTAKSDTPNILVIMGDDIGWYNISAYNNGIMGYQTPNIDQIAKEGVLFTDFYGEQSCTAGRAAFITGQATIRTGMTKVGLPGVPIGIEKEDPTLAELLKPLGYRTGQFGKNHLGDLDKFLPTNHGFDEFFGNLYHLNAEEEPENEDYPDPGVYPGLDVFRPRGVLHSYAADNLQPCEKAIKSPNGEDIYKVSDVTVIEEDDPNLYSYGQRVCDTGPLNKKRMETIDEEVLGRTEQFMLDAKDANEPFFAWFNTTRMHVFTHLKEESQGVTGQGIEADGMVEHDKMVGELVSFLDNEIDKNSDRDTIVIYTTDNGAEVFGWPDGGTTPFRSEKNTNWEGAFRVPAMIRWKGHIPAGVVSNEIMSHIDWVPTLMTAVGVDNIQEKLRNKDKVQTLEYDPYKQYDVHLDGYNFLPYLMNADSATISDDCDPARLTRQATPPYCPPRHEFIYFTDDGYPSAMRFDDWKLIFSEQREEGFNVWQEPYINLRVPKLFNLRRDPFEKADLESGNYVDWRFRRVFLIGPIQLALANLLNTFVDYPPRQRPPSFSINQIVDGVVKEIKIDRLQEEFPIITRLRALLENLQSPPSIN